MSSEEDEEFIDRWKGSLFGLAIGDAFGVQTEFKPPGSFSKINELKQVGGGQYGLNPGEWTDDTSMALCIIESLIELSGEWNTIDVMERFVKWFKIGHLASNGRCFDIGIQTREALDKFDTQEGDKDPFVGPTDEKKSGNGSLMRLAPIPLFFFNDVERAFEIAEENSKLTHGSPQCVDICIYFTGLIIGALNGVDKETLLDGLYCPLSDFWEEREMDPKVLEVVNGSYKNNEPPAIKGSGWVVKTLEAVLWAFNKTDNPDDGFLLLVNIGDDADTTCAIFGQIAGAYYGFNKFSKKLLKVARFEKLERLFENLYLLYSDQPLLDDFIDELDEMETQGLLPTKPGYGKNNNNNNNNNNINSSSVKPKKKMCIIS
eukprot:TRINITY_DN2244_c0_g1_i6.p1 TRINITY_DN2244_c0_g1~~TRINITY_DN2244_c0_g1_i6.p1  ORF type:complete len:374 (+),score=139.42 TRINITY_DN2244_c0_g1_i6:23-1144(+)